MHPTTRQNLLRVLERQALSVARLTAYADRADRDGDRDAAHVLRAIAEMDLGHATEILEHLGWVRSLRENVLASVVGDSTRHGLDLANLEAEARQAGDREAAALMRGLIADETEAALGLLALAGHGPIGTTRACPIGPGMAETVHQLGAFAPHRPGALPARRQAA